MTFRSWCMPHSERRIYLDYASATPLSSAASQAMLRAAGVFGNPGAIHEEGVGAQQLLDEARHSLARAFGVKARELVFTSGGTEANNLAILGAARKRLLRGESLEGTHWIVSAIEHPSVLAAFGEVERLGGTVAFAPCDESGIVQSETIGRMLRRETVFVSVGWANNETGVIQPLADIARTIAAHEKTHGTTVLLHADAGQAPLYLPSTIHSLRVDLLTFDSAKLYGPRGTGALYLSNRAELAPVILGGSQERGLRPGTENVMLAAGFAVAMDEAVAERAEEAARLRSLRDAFSEQLVRALPGLLINGDLARALPHMLNVSLPSGPQPLGGSAQSEYLTLLLDREGIAASTKSACREGEERRSHVVEALGGPQWRAESTLRFSLGRGTTEEEVQKTAEALARLCTDVSSVGTPQKG